METSKTRRAAVGIFGAAAVAALSEIKSAGATGGTCRNEGGNCSGNQECCSGLTCTPTGNGNSKTCQGPDTNGTCPEVIDYHNCVALAYTNHKMSCDVKFGRRKRVNCKKFKKTRNRQVCQDRNSRLISALVTCQDDGVTMAFAACQGMIKAS